MRRWVDTLLLALAVALLAADKAAVFWRRGQMEIPEPEESMEEREAREARERFDRSFQSLIDQMAVYDVNTARRAARGVHDE